MDNLLKQKAVNNLQNKANFKQENISIIEAIVEEHYKNEWKPRENMSFDFVSDIDLFFIDKKDIVKEAKRLGY